ncbi:acyl-CoA desaturase [bacterium SCSIO 12696]|nr:acyl-CoA desaturase [bacterium SCSIO 12696]
MKAIKSWFDNQQNSDSLNTLAESGNDRQVDWVRIIPFILLHLACLGVFFVGFSWIALGVAAALYIARMFAITAFYHRYFSHKTFHTSRMVQFLFALLGASATQRGPLWWAAHHRNHHRCSDREGDAHSPKDGFWWSHMGWFLSHRHFQADYSLISDFQRFPELRWLDRHDLAVPVLLAVFLYGLGALLEAVAPQLNTTGPQMLVWGYFVSTVVLIHASLCINSLAHRFGSVRYGTPDESRNNFWLAFMTLGEGWHNNHHYYPASARQGFYWWEIDMSYYLLKGMERMGLIWNLRTIPLKRRDSNHLAKDAIQNTAEQQG